MWSSTSRIEGSSRWRSPDSIARAMSARLIGDQSSSPSLSSWRGGSSIIGACSGKSPIMSAITCLSSSRCPWEASQAAAAEWSPEWRVAAR